MNYEEQLRQILSCMNQTTADNKVDCIMNAYYNQNIISYEVLKRVFELTDEQIADINNLDNTLYLKINRNSGGIRNRIINLLLNDL